MRTTHAPQGFIAMVTVLVMMAVLLAIGLTVASIGRDEIALAGIVQDGDQAFSVADGCAEEAIDRLKGDSAYAGGTYSLAGGACTVAVTNLGGSNRAVSVAATYADNGRGIDVNVTLKTNTAANAKTVTINSWLESN